MELPTWEDMPEDYDLPVAEMVELIPKGFRYIVQALDNGTVDDVRFERGDIGEVVEAQCFEPKHPGDISQSIRVVFEDGREIVVQDDFYPTTACFYLNRCENPHQLRMFEDVV